MNAKQVIETIYQCSNCNKKYYNIKTAEQCCTPKFCKCGNKIEYSGYTACNICRLQNTYNKAKKIDYKDYEERMFYDPHSENYFSEYEDLKDHYYNNENEDNTPTWVFGCTSHMFRVSVDHLVEPAMEDMYNDFDYNHMIDYQELETFIDKWNSKQDAICYNVDYGLVVEFK